MRVPSNPLTQEEESQLSELLSGSESVALSYARGVFAALACEPSLEDPSDWLPLVLGGEVPNRETLKRVFGLLMRDRFAIRECLELGQPYVPAAIDLEGVTRFCKGFVRTTRKSQVWQKDVDALGQTLPIAVLAGYLSVDSLRKLNPDLVIDEPSWKREQREKLGELVLGLYRHFEPRREEKEAESRAGVEKIGRNEPCPCGSGKKFKRCCGAG